VARRKTCHKGKKSSFKAKVNKHNIAVVETFECRAVDGVMVARRKCAEMERNKQGRKIRIVQFVYTFNLQKRQIPPQEGVPADKKREQHHPII